MPLTAELIVPIVIRKSKVFVLTHFLHQPMIVMKGNDLKLIHVCILYFYQPILILVSGWQGVHWQRAISELGSSELDRKCSVFVAEKFFFLVSIRKNIGEK